MNKQELIDEIKRIHASAIGRSHVSTHPLYSDGVADTCSDVIKLLEQLDEPQKPVVPKFVADWIEYAKKKGWNFARSIRETESETGDVLVTDWYDAHSSIYARAWLDGYEVEKEPVYYVTLPIPTDNVLTARCYLGFNKDGKFDHSYGKPHITWGWKYTFTESEIKAIDERYWAFAVPVGEVVEG